MNFLLKLVPRSIRLFFHKLYVSKKQEDFNPERENVPLKEARSIGILFDASLLENHLPVIEYSKKLKLERKKVSVLGYMNSSRPNTHYSFPVFCNNDLSWRYLPTIFQVNDFMDERFDILINAYNGNSVPLEYISTFSNAKLRVGTYQEGRENCSDFMINLEGEAGVGKILEQIHKLLSNFN